MASRPFCQLIIAFPRHQPQRAVNAGDMDKRGRAGEWVVWGRERTPTRPLADLAALLNEMNHG